MKRRLDAGDTLIILDVRERHEWDLCNIGGVLLPLGTLASRLHELDPAREYAVLCHHGARSLHAARFLVEQGFPSVLNVAGGIDAWATSIDHGMRRY